MFAKLTIVVMTCSQCFQHLVLALRIVTDYYDNQADFDNNSGSHYR